MKRIILTTFILTSCFSCFQDGDFLITGKTLNIPDGTKIYLEEVFDKQHINIIDSTIIKNNTFEFNVLNFGLPKKVVVRQGEFDDFKYFWLESGTTIIDAHNTRLFKAKIIGSKTQSLNQSLSEKTRAASTQYEKNKLLIEFINSHPNSILSAQILNNYKNKWTKKLIDELYETLASDIKRSYYGENINAFIKLNSATEIGDQFVDFKMIDNYDHIRSPSEFEGKILLLEFWASWCEPCRKQNPALVKTYTKYNPQGLEIFAISSDRDKTKWLRAIESDSLVWTNVADFDKGKNNVAALIYGINSIPDNYLINQKGVIVGRGLKGLELERKIKYLVSHQ